MGLLDKVVGHAEVGGDTQIVEEYLAPGEEIIQSFHFLRDAVILTNYGIYDIDVQGLSGKKVQVKFYPKKTIKTISFESAGSFDFDVDIKIGVSNNPIVLMEGGAMNMPISFKVPKAQAEEAKQIIHLVKEHYLL
ncbi:PH domain-containing protein [Methanobrevibacter gottschalkii]|uniref:PH domain-containing protein n=1 Tax=Methanobrevibacter gottschalkii TaxID=190974 RepID=A0A1H7HA39_9EURY|nr:PH domain-containing protein [Methanobrevibacter gottschalkii]SEK47266.1 PH domain-containing protein [Methanobrevibacter gottschalkii]